MILALVVAFIAYIIAQSIINSKKSYNRVLIPPSGNIMVFDTETNGLPKNWKVSLDDTNNWPRILSIAWYKIDPAGVILSSQSFLINPEGLSITRTSSTIHGITNNTAQQYGVLINEALEAFDNDVKDCKYLVAHNIEFDYAVTFCEYRRLNLGTYSLSSVKQICTMKASTDYCKIHSPKGKGYKFPKLTELYRKLFSTSVDEKHEALYDAELCMKCFKELYNQKVIQF